MFTKVHHWTIPWASWIYSNSHLIFLKFILILSSCLCLVFYVVSFLQVLKPQLCVPHLPAHLCLLDLIILIISDKEYKLCRFLLRNFINPPLSLAQTFSSVLCSLTPSMLLSQILRDFPCSHKTSKMKSSYILNFRLLNRTQEDNQIYKCTEASISQTHSGLQFLMNITLVCYDSVLELSKSPLQTTTQITKTNAKPCTTLQISTLSHYTKKWVTLFLTTGLNVLIQPTCQQFYVYH